MRKEGIVTRYNSNCLFCGRPVEATHHLIGGTSKRKQSDQDGLTIPCCNDCHNMGDLSAGSMEIPWQRQCLRS